MLAWNSPGHCCIATKCQSPNADHHMWLPNKTDGRSAAWQRLRHPIPPFVHPPLEETLPPLLLCNELRWHGLSVHMCNQHQEGTRSILPTLQR